MSVDTQPRKLPVIASEPPALKTMGEDVELRTSNEVDGFQYTRFKATLYAIKIVLQLPLFPLWPFFIAKEANDPKFAKHYFKTLSYCGRILIDQIRYGSFWRMLRYNVLMSPAQVQERIEQRSGACSRCAKCCQVHDCLFLGKDEQGDFYCKVYRTDYWFYGTCGRYPLDQRDIDYHACPGFSFEDAAR